MQTSANKNKNKPFLKWAGGKTQILDNLLNKVPDKFNKYIEPFIGGGALYFGLAPKNAIIADSNPELINLYNCISQNTPKIIEYLSQFKNTEESFYNIRSMIFEELDPYFAAARFIYLNRTCFNGLYRVNRKGHFNVPYGRYKNPNLCPSEQLFSASKLLKSARIINGDYRSVLAKNAKKGDFIFLDPPYLPISENSDFKRYTKEQFYENDHYQLAEEVKRLKQLGCTIILTNSNHPMVHDLYGSYNIEVVKTRRNISAKKGTRSGQDVIVTINPD